MLPTPVVRVRLGLNRHTTDHKFEAEPAGYERRIMAPTWLTSVAWAYLSLCFICAGIIAYDIAVNRRRQPLGVMNAVYPITALYLGPFALAFYRRWGRSAARTTMAPGSESRAQADRPGRAMMAMEVSHCGSGCVLGDVISEFSIFGLALTVASTTTLWAEYIGDYVLALAFGILFQYFVIAPVRGLGLKDGLKAAAKADFVALTAFEIGL